MYNGGGWGRRSFLPPPSPLPELRCGAGRPWAAETPPAASGRPAPGAAFPAPASVSAPPGHRDPGFSPGTMVGGGPRPYRCRTGAARRCRRGCCSWKSRPPSCRCAPGLPSAVPAAARCLLAHTLRSGGGWGRGGLLPASLSCHGNPFAPPRLGRRPLRSAPLCSAAEARGETRGAGRGAARRRHGGRRRGAPLTDRGAVPARQRLSREGSRERPGGRRGEPGAAASRRPAPRARQPLRRRNPALVWRSGDEEPCLPPGPGTRRRGCDLSGARRSRATSRPRGGKHLRSVSGSAGSTAVQGATDRREGLWVRGGSCCAVTAGAVCPWRQERGVRPQHPPCCSGTPPAAAPSDAPLAPSAGATDCV